MADYLSVGPTMLLAKFLKSEVIDMFNVNAETYLAKLNEGTKGTILVIRGGIDHHDPNNYIAKYVNSQLKEYNVYLFIKYVPVYGRNIGNDVNDCIKVLKSKHDGYLGLVGFSMGGVAVLSYFSYGHLDVDLAVVACSTLNFERLEDMTQGDYIVKYIQNDGLMCLGYKSVKEAIEAIGLTQEDLRRQMASIEIGLRIYKDWRRITTYVVGEKDPITKSIVWPFDTDVLSVEKASHCDKRVMDAACDLLKENYAEA